MGPLNTDSYGFDWALGINDKFKALIREGDHKPLVNYTSLGKEAMLAIPTPEHYLPLLYVLGLKEREMRCPSLMIKLLLVHLQ
jgi:4,5-DOPA dioxygenase extradiol